ncbi:MAG: hypothetical protein AB7W59_00295 [Acidimicrobiia bacterium]
MNGWKRVRVEDAGQAWNDWFSPDGKWMLAQGHRYPFSAWCLFAMKDGKWRWVRDVPGLQVTIQALARMEAKRSSRGSEDT